MTPHIHVRERDGTQRLLFALHDEYRRRLPQRVVLGVAGPLGILQRLAADENYPTIDVDALLTIATDRLTAAHSQSNMVLAVHEAMECVFDCVMAAEAPYVQQRVLMRSRIYDALWLAFQGYHDAMFQQGLYSTEGMLLYDYDTRRGNHAVVLRRKGYFAFD